MSVKRYWCSSAVELRADGGGTLSANFHANSHFVKASDYDALEAERDGLEKDAMRYRWLRDESSVGDIVWLEYSALDSGDPTWIDNVVDGVIEEGA